MKTIVEIEWDQPTNENWLCPDNIAYALSQVWRNTTFKCVKRELGQDISKATKYKYLTPKKIYCYCRSLEMKFIVAFLILCSTIFAAVPDDLQSISVTIKAGKSQGSGSIITRQIDNDTVSFVLTAAHVVDGLRTTRSVIVNGNTKILVEYKDAEVVQELQQDGRRIGEVKYETKVIKVSDADYGEDLALLMVRRKNAYPLSISTKFKTETNYIPMIGAKLVHVGSLLGQFGANSFTNGLVSQTGRTLPGKGASVKVFDQTTVTAFPGSSGGGVFLEDTGEYVGMLTQSVQQLQGFNFIVPIRRIHEWATSSNLEWAIDPKAKVPTLKEINAITVEDFGAIKDNND